MASNTAPVLDVVRDGKSGLLVNFFGTDAIATTLAAVCCDPEHYQTLRENARETILSRYDRDAICMPQWLRLVEDVAARRAD